MARIHIVDKLRTISGHITHDGVSAWSKYEHWYTQDVWTYYLGRLGLSCTAWKEIMGIGGYLPKQDWQRVTKIQIPKHESQKNFAFDEALFDEADRTGSEEISVLVFYSRGQRTLHVQFGDDSKESSLFVSPHQNLIVGGSEEHAGAFMLNELFLLDVQ